MAYQSLYRRYRSQRFSELRGQAHVTNALKAAVANGRVGHAYLFSGPRGTGKTSTARILAKALNCANLGDDGEPCCECESCLAIEHGRSFDVHELDAASNNKVDDIRDLISRVNLGSPGKTKVYILDEVHMLSAGAENALLKTLEEPPDHVVFVLATTEPHKVVQTIRSRTQPFEFHLLPADELADHVRYVIEDAGLEVDDEAVDYVLRQGGGSARDTLSALDLVAAAGGVPAGSDVGFVLASAIGERDPQAAVAALQEGLTNGQEPRVIGEAIIDVLRGAFLAVMGASLDHLSDTARQRATELGDRLGAGTVTRSLEAVGTALVDMRQAPDPRVPLEVTLLRLCRDERADSAGAGAGAGGNGDGGGAAASGAVVAQLLERITALEQQVASLQQAQTTSGGGGSAGGPAPSRAASTPSRAASTAAAAPSTAEPEPAASSASDGDDAPPSGPAAAARTRLAEVTGKAPQAPRSPRAKQSRPGAGSSTDDSAPQAEAAQAAPAAAAPAAAAAAEPQPDPQPAQTTDTAPTPPAEAPAASSAPQAESSAAAPAPAASGPGPGVGEVARAMDAVLDSVSQRTKVRFQTAKPITVDGTVVTFAVPNAHYVSRCEDVREDVEQALSAQLNRALSIQVVVDSDAPTESLDPAKMPSTPKASLDDSMEDIGPVEELADADDQSVDGVDRLTKAFPGSTVIEPKPE